MLSCNKGVCNLGTSRYLMTNTIAWVSMTGSSRSSTSPYYWPHYVHNESIWDVFSYSEEGLSCFLIVFKWHLCLCVVAMSILRGSARDARALAKIKTCIVATVRCQNESTFNKKIPSTVHWGCLMSNLNTCRLHVARTYYQKLYFFLVYLSIVAVNFIFCIST